MLWLNKGIFSKLKAVGVDEQQAEVQAEALADIIDDKKEIETLPDQDKTIINFVLDSLNYCEKPFSTSYTAIIFIQSMGGLEHATPYD